MNERYSERDPKRDKSKALRETQRDGDDRDEDGERDRVKAPQWFIFNITWPPVFFKLLCKEGSSYIVSSHRSRTIPLSSFTFFQSCPPWSRTQFQHLLDIFSPDLCSVPGRSSIMFQ